MKQEKLRWDRLGDTFDLICLNPDQVGQKAARKLLRKVKVVYSDFKRPFDADASKLWQEWIENPRQPLQEAAYCLLSNWFLTKDKAASISIRAGLALLLWRKLFCAIPERRLTDPESNWRILPQEFATWWERQSKCQRLGKSRPTAAGQ